MTDETREQIKRDADAAFNEKRTDNPYFWTAKDEEPEVVFWKETWSDGATHQHPIAFAAGRNQAIEEMIAIHRSVIDKARQRQEQLTGTDEILIAMSCSITSGEEAIKKLEALKTKV